MTKRAPARPAPSPFRRHWMLAPGTVFLNHGSFGACPRAILKFQSDLRRQMEAEPVQFLWRRYEERLEPSRAALAAFLGARARDVVFVTNSTTGVNAFARSFPLRPGDEVLTTSHDYNACHNVLIDAARRSGAKVVTARIPFPIRSDDDVLDAVMRAVTRRTRFAMLDHITSNTALILPIARLIRELDSRGIDTLVDGAHAPGVLPLDLPRLRPAAYTGNLHKWVCAPKGAGFLWVREDHQSRVMPAVVSHGNNTPRPGYHPFQDRFDWAGTFDPTAWFSVGESIRWMSRLLRGGWPAVRKHNHDLAVRARLLLCERLGVEPPCPESMLGSMATLALPAHLQGRPKRAKIDPEQLRLYDNFGIEVPLFRLGQPATRCFRVSAQLYNTLADFEYLARALLALD